MTDKGKVPEKNNELKTVQVGEVIYPPGSLEPGVTATMTFSDPSEINSFNGRLFIVMNFPSLSKREIKSVNKGEGKLGLFFENDILFFLFKFRPEFEWSDCPFHISFYKDVSKLNSFNEGERLTATFLLIEHPNMVLKAIRLLTFSTEQSLFLESCLRHQLNNPISRETYNQQIDDIYRRYPSSSVMVNRYN